MTLLQLHNHAVYLSITTRDKNNMIIFNRAMAEADSNQLYKATVKALKSHASTYVDSSDHNESCSFSLWLRLDRKIMGERMSFTSATMEQEFNDLKRDNNQSLESFGKKFINHVHMMAYHKISFGTPRHMALKYLMATKMPELFRDQLIDIDSYTTWWKGKTLREFIERCELKYDTEKQLGTLPSKYIVKPTPANVPTSGAITGRATNITPTAPSAQPRVYPIQPPTPNVQADPRAKAQELTDAIQGDQSLNTVKNILQQWHNTYHNTCPFHTSSRTHNFLQCSTTYGICRETNNINALKQSRLANNVVIIPRQQQNPHNSNASPSGTAVPNPYQTCTNNPPSHTPTPPQAQRPTYAPRQQHPQYQQRQQQPCPYRAPGPSPTTPAPCTQQPPRNQPNRQSHTPPPFQQIPNPYVVPARMIQVMDRMEMFLDSQAQEQSFEEASLQQDNEFFQYGPDLSQNEEHNTNDNVDDHNVNELVTEYSTLSSSHKHVHCVPNPTPNVVATVRSITKVEVPQRQLPSIFFKAVLDSGATDTMTGDAQLMETITPFYNATDGPTPQTPHIVLGDDKTHHPIQGYGTIRYKLCGKVICQNCYYVPALKNITLISVSQHCQRQGCFVLHEKNSTIMAFPSFVLSLANHPEIHALVTLPTDSNTDYDETKAILVNAPKSTSTTLISSAVKKYLPKSSRVSFQETIKFKCHHPTATVPKRLCKSSSTFNVFSSQTKTVPPLSSALISTGISMRLPPDMKYHISAIHPSLSIISSKPGGFTNSTENGDFCIPITNTSNTPITITYHQAFVHINFSKNTIPYVHFAHDDTPTIKRVQGGSSKPPRQQCNPLINVIPPRAPACRLVNRNQNNPYRLHHNPRLLHTPDNAPDIATIPTDLAPLVTMDDILHNSNIHKVPVTPTTPPSVVPPPNASSVPTSTTPPRPRTNLSEPNVVSISHDNLAKAVGFRHTNQLIKHFHTLGTKHVHIQHQERPPFLDPGDTATMNSKRRNTSTSTPPPNYSDIWHIDIGYGPCTSIGGVKYVLFTVDKFSRYKLCYGLKNLKGSLLDAIKRFVHDIGVAPKLIRTDFDSKLIGGNVETFLINEKIKIESSPPYRQHQNGLVERNWQSIVRMSRNWLTSSMLPSAYWYFAVKRATEIGNILPTNHIKNQIITPYELVFNQKVDYRTLFPMFSTAYIKVPKVRQEDRSKWHSQTIKCIAVGRCPKSDGLLFYHPSTKQLLSCGDGYKFDTSSPSGPQFSENYDQNFYMTTRASAEDAIHCPPTYQQGQHAYIQLEPNIYTKVHILNIPFNDDTKPYTVQATDTGDIHQVLAKNFHASDPTHTPSDTPSALTPLPHIPWIHDGAHITVILESTGNTPKQGRLQFHDDEWYFHQGQTDRFTPVILPNFLDSAQQLIINRKLFKGWITRAKAIAARSVRATSNILSALIVKGKVCAKNLDVQTAPSLLHHHKLSTKDRNIWDAAYLAEYQGLVDIDTWELISEAEYKRLQPLYKGLLPTMAITTIKKDGDGNPTRVKYRIVALGNLDPNDWSKQDCFAPVLSQMELRLLTSIAASKGCIPKSGNITQAFCQSSLPPGESYICTPPAGCPITPPHTYWKLKKTLYGLKRSPKHFYDLACKLLKRLGLKAHPTSPCLFYGHIIPGHPPIYLGLYVDDFIYFSESDEVEKVFKQKFSKLISIDWNGDIDYFLGIKFTTSKDSNGNVSITMSQEAFIDHLLKLSKLDGDDVNSVRTPYCNGYVIDMTPKTKPSPNQHKVTHYMQTLIGCLNWLSTSTRPDIATATNLLAKYTSCPNSKHIAAVKRVIRYLKGTKTRGITFTNTSAATLNSYIKFPIADPNNLKLISMCDANWGPQDQSAPNPDKPVPPMDLFKSRLLSGYLLWINGPIHWMSKRQTITARSSTKAEIYATDECVKALMYVKMLLKGLQLSNDFMP
jgi:dUTPase